MAVRPEATDPPVALHRPQRLRPVIEPLDIPSLWGPLRIYRGTLDEVWTILSTVVDRLVVRVRIGGRDFEGDSLEALDEQRDAMIEELEIKASSEPYGVRIQRGGMVAYAAIPRCGSAATPERREAMRQVMDALQRTRRRWWFVRPTAFGSVVLLAVAMGSAFYLTRNGVPFGAQVVTTLFVSGVVSWPLISSLGPRAHRTEIRSGYRRDYGSRWIRHRGQVFALVLVLVGAVVGALLTVVFSHLIR